MPEFKIISQTRCHRCGTVSGLTRSGRCGSHEVRTVLVCGNCRKPVGPDDDSCQQCGAGNEQPSATESKKS